MRSSIRVPVDNNYQRLSSFSRVFPVYEDMSVLSNSCNDRPFSITIYINLLLPLLLIFQRAYEVSTVIIATFRLSKMPVEVKQCA